MAAALGDLLRAFRDGRGDEAWPDFLDCAGGLLLQAARGLIRDNDEAGDAFVFLCERLAADVLVAAPRWKIGTTSGVGAAFLHTATGGPDVVSSVPIILTGAAPAAFDHFASRVAVANVDGIGSADLVALDAWDSAEVTGDVFAGPILATGQTSNPLLRIAPAWTGRPAGVIAASPSGTSTATDSSIS